MDGHDQFIGSVSQFWYPVGVQNLEGSQPIGESGQLRSGFFFCRRHKLCDFDSCFGWMLNNENIMMQQADEPRARELFADSEWSPGMWFSSKFLVEQNTIPSGKLT